MNRHPHPQHHARPSRPLRPFRPSHAVVALTMAAWLPQALALDQGVTPAGVAYASGGVGQGEREEMQALRAQHNFWLMTAAARSGVYLADVEVRIVPRGQEAPVLEHRMDGPWLYAQLPAGRYEVQAAWNPGDGQPLQVRRSVITIAAGQRQQMVLYFKAADEVGPGR